MVVQRMSIAPDNLNAYDVEVEEAEHIPDLVEITQELGIHSPVLIGLDHKEEPHAMRGRYEKKASLDEGEVLRRQDGGKTVYSDVSKCALNFGVPIDSTQTKKADTYTSEVHDFISRRLGADFDRGDRDLYIDGVKDGDQVVGASSRFKNNSAVLRAYWAEDMPKVYHLMRKDGVGPQQRSAYRAAMEQSMETMDGFYEQVMDEFNAYEISSTELIEATGKQPGVLAQELLEEEGQREPDVCFLMKPNGTS